MPVKNESKLSIDFIYVYDIESTGESTEYQMRFTHTDIGERIQIFLTSTGEGIELPAKMFPEVTEFLIQRGVLKGNKTSAPQNIPVIRSGQKISVPTVSKQIVSNHPPVHSLSAVAQEESQEDAFKLTEEENKRILAERKHAQEKNKSSQKKVIKRDQEDEDWNINVKQFR